MQPVRVFDTWYWVLHLHEGDTDHLSDSVSLVRSTFHTGLRFCWSQPHLLQGRRDRDDLLYGTPQPLDVVVPVQNLSVQETSDGCMREEQQSSGTPSQALCWMDASCVLFNPLRNSRLKGPISQRRRWKWRA